MAPRKEIPGKKTPGHPKKAIIKRKTTTTTAMQKTRKESGARKSPDKRMSGAKARAERRGSHSYNLRVRHDSSVAVVGYQCTCNYEERERLHSLHLHATPHAPPAKRRRRCLSVISVSSEEDEMMSLRRTATWLVDHVDVERSQDSDGGQGDVRDEEESEELREAGKVGEDRGEMEGWDERHGECQEVGQEGEDCEEMELQEELQGKEQAGGNGGEEVQEGSQEELQGKGRIGVEMEVQSDSLEKLQERKRAGGRGGDGEHEPMLVDQSHQPLEGVHVDTSTCGQNHAAIAPTSLSDNFEIACAMNLSIDLTQDFRPLCVSTPEEKRVSLRPIELPEPIGDFISDMVTSVHQVASTLSFDQPQAVVVPANSTSTSQNLFDPSNILQEEKYNKYVFGSSSARRLWKASASPLKTTGNPTAYEFGLSGIRPIEAVANPTSYEFGQSGIQSIEAALSTGNLTSHESVLSGIRPMESLASGKEDNVKASGGRKRKRNVNQVPSTSNSPVPPVLYYDSDSL